MPTDKNGDYIMEGDKVRLDWDCKSPLYRVVHISNREVGCIRVYGHRKRLEYFPSRTVKICGV